jgi:predicted transcriptional regulator
MTGTECRELRAKLGIKQTRLAWDCAVDATLVSRWEAGVYKLKAAQVESIRDYLARHLQAAKQEFATLELPELDRAIDQVAR